MRVKKQNCNNETPHFFRKEYINIKNRDTTNKSDPHKKPRNRSDFFHRSSQKEHIGHYFLENEQNLKCKQKFYS